MKILFVWPAAEFSTFDVAHGLRGALARAGYELRDYKTFNRVRYHAHAIEESEVNVRAPFLLRRASETMVVDALEWQPDWVLITSGLGIHPDGVALLKRAGFKVAVVHTESPYEDVPQAEFSQLCDVSFTNDAWSAKRHGWHYLPHSYDPEVHFPRDFEADNKSDVLFVGTGWANRQAIFEAVDWTGIDLKIIGNWPELTEASPLHRLVEPGSVDNFEMPRLYASAKIALNLHRPDPTHNAWSLNPRAREVAACGCFQLSDYRPELREVFGHSVPTFMDGATLGDLVRYYLDNPDVRERMRKSQQQAVVGETFDERVPLLVEVLERAAARRVPA